MPNLSEKIFSDRLHVITAACAPLINAIACALLCQSEPTTRGSPYRQALFAALEADDDRVILASLAVLMSIFDRNVDREILESAQMVPLALAEKAAEPAAAVEGEDAPAVVKVPLAELIAKVEKGIAGLVEGDLASPPPVGLENGCPEIVVPEGLEPEPEPSEPAALAAPPAVLEEGQTASVDDLLDRLVAVLGRHVDGIRVCVLQMAMKLILTLRQPEGPSAASGGILEPGNVEKVRVALESAAVVVRAYLDPSSQWANSMFVFLREELTKLEQRPFNFEHIISDPVTMMPLEQDRNPFIDLNKRLPANEEEKVRRDIRVFLLLRSFVQTLSGTAPPEGEDPLPMTLNQLFMTPRFKEQEAIDLSTRISTQHWKTSCACGPKREQRYLLITDKSVLIVEPDNYRCVRALPIPHAHRHRCPNATTFSALIVASRACVASRVELLTGCCPPGRVTSGWTTLWFTTAAQLSSCSRLSTISTPPGCTWRRSQTTRGARACLRRPGPSCSSSTRLSSA